MKREALIQALAIEEQLVRYLKAQSDLGIRSKIPHATTGYQAASARKAALQHLLEASDTDAS